MRWQNDALSDALALLLDISYVIITTLHEIHIMMAFESRAELSFVKPYFALYNKQTMDDNQTPQKEFFEFEKPKKSAPVFGKIFARSNVAITLTLERVVFISIGFIMLMVIIYALGIEKGKRLSKTTTAQTTVPIIQPRISSPIIKPIEVKPPSETKIDLVPMKSQTVQETKPYTIVAVTLTKKDGASLEVNRLKKQGYDAFVLQSDSYFLVCIGSYPDNTSAQSKKALSRIRQTYKDAYFKFR